MTFRRPIQGVPHDLKTESRRGVRHRHRRKSPGTAITASAYRHRAGRRLYPRFPQTRKSQAQITCEAVLMLSVELAAAAWGYDVGICRRMPLRCRPMAATRTGAGPGPRTAGSGRRGSRARSRRGFTPGVSDNQPAFHVACGGSERASISPATGVDCGQPGVRHRRNRRGCDRVSLTVAALRPSPLRSAAPVGSSAASIRRRNRPNTAFRPRGRSERTSRGGHCSRLGAARESATTPAGRGFDRRRRSEEASAGYAPRPH